MDPVTRWLLDPADPAARAVALVEVAGRSPDEAEVVAARAEVATRGSAVAILAGLDPEADGRALYVPKYVAAYHRIVALAEMRVGPLPIVARVLDRLLDRYTRADGGFGNPTRTTGHLCVTGNLARAALLLGRGDDPRVAGALDWLVRAQRDDGGWHCFPDEEPGGTLDSWEALGAFAAVPPAGRTGAVRDAARRGVEFYLDRALGVGAGYAPWERIHFPRHYYYDVLAGLEFVTALGRPDDPRLAPALAWLRGKRGADGRWRIEAQHPDLEDPGYPPHPPELGPPTPLVAEPAGEASRWATLAALRVLRAAEPA